MSTTASIPSDADILLSVLDAFDGENLSSEAAAAFMKLRFDDATVKRIHELQEQNRQGTISDSERLLLSRYLRVGQLIDLLQARIRSHPARSATDE